MNMPTVINEKVHGIIDYAVVVFILLSPTIFGFTGTIAIITYALAGIHFALTAITDSPMGIIKVLPFDQRVKGNRGVLITVNDLSHSP